MTHISSLRLLGLMLVAGSLFACASKEPGFYRHSPVVKALEVPPDLTAPDFQDTYEIPQISKLLVTQPVLSSGEAVRLQRDGRLRWLEIDSETTLAWEHVKEFFSDKKLKLDWENRKLGIMETEWLTHYDSEYAMDKFRVRVEPGMKPKTTLIFVAHRGVQRELDDGALRPVWTERPGAPELEIEFLSSLLEYMSLEPQRKQQLVEEMKRQRPESTLKLDAVPPALEIHTEYARSWTLLGLAVDRLGHIIESRDQKSGKMVIRINKEETGLTSPFGERKKMSIKVTEMNEQNTRVNIENDKGGADDSQEAVNLLIRLKESL